MSTHQLQVNNSGAWKTVLRFDGNDKEATDAIWRATEMLGEASTSAPNWRIATSERHPVVHAHMGPHTYGLWLTAQVVSK